MKKNKNKKINFMIEDEEDLRVGRSNSLPNILSPSPTNPIKRKDTNKLNSQIGMVEYTGMIKITLIGARKLPTSG